MRDEWVEVLAKRLGPPIFTTGDEVRFNCFRDACTSGTKDTHFHLYLNTASEKYFCHKCQRGGTLEYLTKLLGIASPGKSLVHFDMIVQQFLSTTAKLPPSVDPLPISWPEEYLDIFPGTQAYAYCIERGMTQEIIDHYQIGFGKDILDKRIIFPDMSKDDELLYWVARTYATDGKNRAKYRNADAPREKQVFNLGRVAKAGYKQVVICEGPISAIISGYNAVATYGKYVTGEQVERLARYKADEYIIAGDGDGLYHAVSLATRLHRRRLNVKFARFYGKEDPASVGHDVTQDRIKNSMQWNSTSVLELIT